MTAFMCGATGGTGVPCPEPGVPCWDACALDGSDCGVWEPVFRPEPHGDLQEGPSPVRAKACGDCAYKPGSPERRANDGDLPRGFDLNRPFHCHDGMPALRGWTYPGLDYSLWAGGLPSMQDGFLIGSYDYQPVQRNGRGWQADGRPLVVCAGWAAHVDSVRRAQAERRERL